jgi:16S rRNA processing protein RimM
MKTGDDLIEIGFIRAAHGLRGQVVIHAHSGQAESLTQYGALLNADGSKHYKIKVGRASESDFLCSIDGLTDRNAAEAMRGTKLFTRASSLPPTEDDSYYIRDLIGLAVKDPSGKTLGKVFNVVEVGSNSAFDIEFDLGEKKQTELLLYTKQNVPQVDIKGGFIVVSLPDGLLTEPEKSE